MIASLATANNTYWASVNNYLAIPATARLSVQDEAIRKVERAEELLACLASDFPEMARLASDLGE